MRKLFFYLTLPLRPIYWVMNESYDKHWDDKLTELLSKYEFRDITNYHASLGDNRLWISNHPYASFVFDLRINDDIIEEVRPSRYTLHIARKKLLKAKYILRTHALKRI